MVSEPYITQGEPRPPQYHQSEMGGWGDGESFMGPPTASQRQRVVEERVPMPTDHPQQMPALESKGNVYHHDEMMWRSGGGEAIPLEVRQQQQWGYERVNNTGTAMMSGDRMPMSNYPNPRGGGGPMQPPPVQEMLDDRLGPMCERFLAWYSHNQPSNTIVVEEIAMILRQDVNRLTDIMEILSNLGIVSKTSPARSYDWQGLQGLQRMMYSITQAEKRNRELANNSIPPPPGDRKFRLPGTTSLLQEYQQEEDDKKKSSSSSPMRMKKEDDSDGRTGETKEKPDRSDDFKSKETDQRKSNEQAPPPSKSTNDDSRAVKVEPSSSGGGGGGEGSEGGSGAETPSTRASQQMDLKRKQLPAAVNLSDHIVSESRANEELADRHRPPYTDERKSNSAGALARSILTFFITENVKLVPFNRVLEILRGDDGDPSKPLPYLDKIRDAIDVLGALELVEMVDTDSRGGGPNTMALMWIGNDILQVSDGGRGGRGGGGDGGQGLGRVVGGDDQAQNWQDDEKLSRVYHPESQNENKSSPHGLASARSSQEKGGGGGGGGSQEGSAKRLPRYLKKSMAAMRRRRVGGRFAPSVNKESNQNTDEARTFFALSRDEEGIRAVQSFPFRHSAWSHHHGRVGIRSCRCVKSRCENRYCDCFASGAACLNCSCTNCGNVQRPAKRRRLVARGCRCMKSHCSKGHCDCFAAGKGCSQRCQCVNCENPLGSQSQASSATATAAKAGGNSRNPTQVLFVLTQSKNSAFDFIGPKNEDMKEKSRASSRRRRRQTRSRRSARSSHHLDSEPYHRVMSGKEKHTSTSSKRVGTRRLGGGEWLSSGHPYIGKDFVRVLDGVAETGVVQSWMPANDKVRRSQPMWLIRFHDGEIEHCDEQQTRRGVMESSLKPGKRVKVLNNGKWVQGTLRKVSRTTNGNRPYGVKLAASAAMRAGRSVRDSRLVWVPRSRLRHIDDEDDDNSEYLNDRTESDGFDSETTPDERGSLMGDYQDDEATPRHDAGVLGGGLENDDDDSASTSAQELVDRCYVNDEQVEWKFGMHWVKAIVKRRVSGNRSKKRETYAIQVVDAGAVECLGKEFLPCVDERFLRPCEEGPVDGKKTETPMEFKRRATTDDKDLIIRLLEEGSKILDVGDANGTPLDDDEDTDPEAQAREDAAKEDQESMPAPAEVGENLDIIRPGLEDIVPIPRDKKSEQETDVQRDAQQNNIEASNNVKDEKLNDVDGETGGQNEAIDEEDDANPRNDIDDNDDDAEKKKNGKEINSEELRDNEHANQMDTEEVEMDKESA